MLIFFFCFLQKREAIEVGAAERKLKTMQMQQLSLHSTIANVSCSSVN